MLRKKGPFISLGKDPTKEIRFWSELITILNLKELSLAFVIADKNKSKDVINALKGKVLLYNNSLINDPKSQFYKIAILY